MADLLRKQTGTTGKVHNITAENAGWGYVGFGLYRLKAGDTVTEQTGDTEVILVLVEGKAEISGAGKDFGELGERMNVFERTPPHCVYIPNGTDWSATATTDLTLAVCTAPGNGGHDAQIIGPAGIDLEERGKGANTRYIHNIGMENRDVADSLLVTEVFTPSGNWSSYPPHRHDEDNYPDMTYLEETYYHRLNPSQGFGFKRVFTEDGGLEGALSERYTGWQTQLATDMLAEGALGSITDRVLKEDINPEPRSDRQEIRGNYINRFVRSGRQR